MKTAINPFKQALKDKRAQYGLWVSLMGPLSTEICAAAGFDWILLDAEHTPNDPMNVMLQSQVLAGYPNTHAIARLPMGHGWTGQALIKQYLDVGIQTLLIPMVETAEQAREIVRCAKYPPLGIRGMAATRASGWGRNANYAKEANDQVCLLVQAETRKGIENLDEIAAVEGVDGVFIGPSDLSAAFGHVGDPWHPEMEKIIADSFARIQKAGKAVGILTLDEKRAKEHVAMGATFIAVGTDSNLMVKSSSDLIAKFKGAPAPAAAPKGNYGANMNAVLKPTNPRMYPDEWAARVQLAACYRIFDMLGWTEMIYNHITLRLPESVTGGEKQFLINPFGLHYSEVTASNLLKIDVKGKKLDDNPWPVNPAGFTVHSAIHENVDGAHCVMHTHTTTGLAVASTKEGLAQNNFYSAQLHDMVAYHDFEGITVHSDECPRLLKNMGNKPVLILRNHGLLSWGPTIALAFVRLWTLQRACDVQVAQAALGAAISVPDSVAMKTTNDSFQWEAKFGAGQDVFDALVRRVDKIDPSYKS